MLHVSSGEVYYNLLFSFKQKNDEVLVPALTYVAAFAITALAKPISLDVN